MKKTSITLFIIWLIFLCAGIILSIAIETPNNAGLWATVKFAFIPVGIFLAIASHVMAQNPSVKKTQDVWLIVFLLPYPMTLMFSHGYSLLYNAATASGETIAITGVIEKKYIGTKSASRTVSLRNEKNGEIIGIDVSADFYSNASPGDVYTFCFYSGGLEIPFFWRMNGPPPC